MRPFALGAGIHPQGFKHVFRQDFRQQLRSLRPYSCVPRTSH
jgi:hypothetical protein